MSVSSRLIYLSAGCNQSPHVTAWKDDLFLYGSDANIIVCNTNCSEEPQFSSFRAVKSLRHHTAPINCIRWLKDLQPKEHGASSSDCEFISVSSDKTCAIWKCAKNNIESIALQQQIECDAPIQACSGLKLTFSGKKQTLIGLVRTDGVLELWMRQDDVGFEITQRIQFNRGLVFDVDLAEIPNENGVLVACACDDGAVHVFGAGGSLREFHKMCVLPGHDDWIRTVQFSAPDEHGQIHLLSAGQDCTVRLWSLLDTNANSQNRDDLWSKVHRYAIDIPELKNEYQIMYETILLGHEGWIYGVQWAPVEWKEGVHVQPMRILSCSMDKTAVVWEPESSFGGIWLDRVRVGEVGGNNLGFYGCQFSSDGNSILTHSFDGSLHVWNRNEKEQWMPGVVTGGHFGPVMDITWDPRGLYLLSTSQDQTTRAHGPWVRDGQLNEWHEISRPQVHGYDLQTVAATGNYSFVSGADEKIVRHFRAPKTFMSILENICHVNVEIEDLTEAPEGASVPALGLSNKPVYESEKGQGDQERYPSERYPEVTFQPKQYSQCPTEEDLIQNTLWSETHKLYGHGYEISSLACTHALDLVASASRANHPEHAEIFLWKPQSASKDHWDLCGRLGAHQLTVTQMAFSHSDKFLLSVSRDRTWALFRRNHSAASYSLFARPTKNASQTRIIWTCAWTPDDKFFATGSRDKTVYIYAVDRDASPEAAVTLLSRLSFDSPVTAVTLNFFFEDTSRYLLVSGTEDGHIVLHKVSNSEGEEPVHVLNLPDRHFKAVNRLHFRPHLLERRNELLLTSCGEDRSVKLFLLSD